jgi:alkanesulfonate monooxygenase SsuD/methylene tetrahydromethanopterin reductase-like flavin-dependent oxidoreductase (luciferase family)
MEFAIQTTAATYAGFRDAATWAERKGLAAFAIPDHYLYAVDSRTSRAAYDAFAVMAGLARETSTIELVILVSAITFRHPAVLAKNAATIQDMSGGRFKLGLGTGWLEAEHTQFGMEFPDREERFLRLEEALGYLRAAFANPPLDFAGDYYDFAAFDMLPRPELKLVVGGTGAVRTPRLAGTYADELNAYPAVPNEYRAKIERARHAARSAGRDPQRLLISSSGQIIAAETEGEYRGLLEEIAAEHDTSPDQLEEEAAKRNAPRGTWQQVRGILAELEELGMSRFYIQGAFDPDALELRLEKLT